MTIKKKFKVIGVQSGPEWSTWLDKVTKFFRTDASKLFDVSVAEYAKNHGFDEPPPERIS